MASDFFSLIERQQAATTAAESIVAGDEDTSVSFKGQSVPSFKKAMKDSFLELYALAESALPFNTRSDMEAAGEPGLASNGVHKFAVVRKDSDSSNNGYWVWTGSSWEKSPWDFEAEFTNRLDSITSRVTELEQYTGSASSNDPLTSRVADLETWVINENYPFPDGGSIRFHPRNGQNGGKIGFIIQPIAGLTDVLAPGKTLSIKARLPRSQWPFNRRYQTVGGNRFEISWTGSQYFSVDIAGSLLVKFRQSGATPEFSFEIPGITSESILIELHNDGIDVVCRIFDATTGELIVAHTEPDSAPTAGLSFHSDIFCIGCSNYASMEAAMAASTYAAPNSFFVGSLADFALFGGGLLSDAEVREYLNDRGSFFDTGSRAGQCDFFRGLSGVDGLTSPSFQLNLSTEDAVVYGDVLLGGSIGPVGGVAISSRTPYFIAGIRDPQDDSARISLAVTIPIEAFGAQVFGRFFDADTGTTVVARKRIGVMPSAETGSITLDVPVYSGWLAAEFDWTDADDLTHQYLYAEPFTAGLKVMLWGQSQMAICMGEYAGHAIPDKDTVPATLAVTNVKSYRGGVNVEAPAVILQGGASDRVGLIGYLDRWSQKTRTPVCIVANTVAGTGVDQLLNDADSARDWSRLAELTAMAGGDISVHLWQWYTNNSGAANNFPQQILEPLFTGVPSSGADSTSVPVVDHHIFDGIDFRRTAHFILSPATRATVGDDGAADYDLSSNVGVVRDSQVEWAQNRGFIVGPSTSDILIANGGTANTGGPHQHPTAFKGNARLGIRLAEAVLRWFGKSTLKNPTVSQFRFVDANRTQIAMTINLPNGGVLQTAGDNPNGIEFSEDGGETWSRSGFSTSISGLDTVICSKSSGSWPENLVASFQRGGPLSYGVEEDDETLLNGCLYDSVELDVSEFGDELGTPVLGSNKVYAVQAAE